MLRLIPNYNRNSTSYLRITASLKTAMSFEPLKISSWDNSEEYYEKSYSVIACKKKKKKKPFPIYCCVMLASYF